MPNIVIIDLQPLSCMGIEAYVREHFPDIRCQMAHSKQAVEGLKLDRELDLVILGLNREPIQVANYLKEKVMDASLEVPVIILYEVFDIAHLKQFAGHTVTGFLAKYAVADELNQCISSVLAGSSFLCERTDQHIINAFVDRSAPVRLHRPKKVRVPNG